MSQMFTFQEFASSGYQIEFYFFKQKYVLFQVFKYYGSLGGRSLIP